MRRLAPLVAALTALTLALLPAAATADPDDAPATGTVAYQLPAAGHVLRRFDPPPDPYGTGHRGVDLAVPAGGLVRAAGGGRVVFAGEVAGATWVTVEHADGVRTSYGHLAEVRVRAGADVARGAPLGTAAGTNGDRLRPAVGLHWSARRGDTYVDPLSLLEGGTPRPTLVGPGGWAGSHLVVDPFAPYEGGTRFGVLAPPSPTADHRGFARAPNHHHLVQLPGYGTQGPDEVLDAGDLGYGPDDTSVFSYRGCTPTPAGCEPHPYGGTATDLTVEQAADLLDEHLRALQRAQPQRPVDLLGHSMGGDVATWYLTHRYDPADPGLPPVANLVTVATPHGGSGVAYLARAVGDDALLGHQAEVVRQLAVDAGLDGPGRVGFGSSPLDRYGSRAGQRSPRRDRDPQRLQDLRVRVLEIAGSRDLVVGRRDAGSAGDALVLPGGHGSVTGTQAMYLAVHDHLAGRPVTGAGAPAGWLSDEAADLARWTGTLVDVAPYVGFTRALAADDVPRALWEVGKLLVGGPNQRGG